MNSFQQRNSEFTEKMVHDPEMQALSRQWFNASLKFEYSHHFSWLGMPIIQFPPDIIAMQEIVWKVKPDLIIETGIARGGSIVFYASLLEMIGGDGEVLGIDVDIRKENRVNIEQHPMMKRITMLEGSSIDETLVQKVNELTKNKSKVLVILDSNHTHEHVLRELEFFSPMVTKDSYLVVFDTVIEDIPDEFCKDRPWSKGDNPKTAVREFLKKNNDFVLDQKIVGKLLLTAFPDGCLKKVK